MHIHSLSPTSFPSAPLSKAGVGGTEPSHYPPGPTIPAPLWGTTLPCLSTSLCSSLSSLATVGPLRAHTTSLASDSCPQTLGFGVLAHKLGDIEDPMQEVGGHPGMAYRHHGLGSKSS